MAILMLHGYTVICGTKEYGAFEVPMAVTMKSTIL
jgi:hypothetical protein